MCKDAHKQIIILTLIGLVSLLAACANTNGSSEKSVESVDESPLDGIWIGEFDIRGRGPYDFTVMQLNDKAYAYSLEAKAICLGTLSFDGEHTIHKYVLFALDGGPFDWATVTGTLEYAEQDQRLLVSHFKTLNGGDTGALNIAYNKVYEQSSSSSDMQGDWTYTDRDDLTTNISIDGEGTLVGDDSDGCEYLGFVDIINPNYNAYKVNIEIKECGSTSGEYEGVSFLADGAINMLVANPNYAFYYAFQ